MIFLLMSTTLRIWLLKIRGLLTGLICEQTVYGSLLGSDMNMTLSQLSAHSMTGILLTTTWEYRKTFLCFLQKVNP